MGGVGGKKRSKDDWRELKIYDSIKPKKISIVSSLTFRFGLRLIEPFLSGGLEAEINFQCLRDGMTVPTSNPTLLLHLSERNGIFMNLFPPSSSSFSSCSIYREVIQYAT